MTRCRSYVICLYAWRLYGDFTVTHWRTDGTLNVCFIWVGPASVSWSIYCIVSRNTEGCRIKLHRPTSILRKAVRFVRLLRENNSPRGMGPGWLAKMCYSLKQILQISTEIHQFGRITKRESISRLDSTKFTIKIGCTGFFLCVYTHNESFPWRLTCSN